MNRVIMPWGRGGFTTTMSPYPYGWLDDFLPSELYENLEDSFVSPDSHPDLNVLGKGKKRISFHVPPTPGLLGDFSPDWKDFLEFLSRREVRADALEWVRNILPLESIPHGSYRELFALRHLLTPDQVNWYCEFSSLDPAVYLPPHTDSVDKLLVFVLYFAPQGWRQEWGGGTEVYSAHDEACNNNFSNFFLPHERVTRVDRSDYRPNRVFFFAKNQMAWHGVSPVSSSATLPRRTFNFSLRVRPDADLPQQMMDLMAAIRQFETGAFQQ